MIRRFLRKLGRLQGALLLSLLYLLIWLPVGLLSRCMADWLRRRKPPGSAWLPRPARLNEPSHAKDPF